MCESHTIYHLCGHVKIRTIVQCADLIDKLIASESAIACSHQVCEDNVSDDIHVFPDICDTCKTTGVGGDVMEVPGVMLEVLRAWRLRNKSTSAAAGADMEDNEPVEIKELETLESISLSEDADTSTLESTSALESARRRSLASSSTSNGMTPELSQIKTRVAALVSRTERLLTRVRAQKLPTLGQSSA